MSISNVILIGVLIQFSISERALPGAVPYFEALRQHLAVNVGKIHGPEGPPPSNERVALDCRMVAFQNHHYEEKWPFKKWWKPPR